MVTKDNKKSFVKSFTIMLAVFLLPFVLIFVGVFLLPPVYEDTFLGELSQKYDRLNSISEKKIVVVGGSSVAFGLDSRMMEENMGYKVVNFGLYADLGTKLMMDLSESAVNSGDIVILAPEMSRQTLSLFFNGETALMAMDGKMLMLKDVKTKDLESLIGAMPKLAFNKIKYLATGTRPQNTGAYKKENFNEYGDNIFDRPYKELTGFVSPITLDFASKSGYEDFIQYVNQYTAAVRAKGGEVYFSFPPMNKDAITNTDESIKEFYKDLSLSLDCKVISNIYDYILDDGYFFDSEFHLNNSGVTVRTVRLIDDIKRELMRDDMTMPESQLPKPTGHRPAVSSDDENEENFYFVLEKAADDTWAIVGLNESGMEETELIIPARVDDADISTISKGAFSGSKAVKLTVGKNIRRIDGGALSGSSISEIIIPNGIGADNISVPNNSSDELFIAGGQTRLAIFVDPELYEEFISDYFWGDYGAYLAKNE